MKSLLTRALLFLTLLLGGCTSVDSLVDHGRSVKDVQRFFVLSNSNDNHALDQQIVMALRARGRTVEVGPRTMMPEDTQVVVSYQDHWAWDFGDRLVFLKITIQDPTADQPFGAATFSAKVPSNDKTAVTVNQLLDSLFAQ